MILIPIKNMAFAKQRMAAWFDQPTRTLLAQTMLQDVCDAVAGIQRQENVTLVTSDPFAMELARRFEFVVMSDHDNPGETEAIARATRVCVARGADSTLVLPADIPLVTTDELQQILDAAPTQGSLLVASADGRGTNAAFRRPADLFPLQFGDDSFKPHLAAAQATGKPWVAISLAGVELDVDTPGDLQTLARSPGETRTQRLVRGWNLSDLPSAASE